MTKAPWERALRLAANNADLPRQFATSAVTAVADRRQFDTVETFCMFIGYPRSGHSLVGSLLDAHPEAVIAHELDALRCIQVGFRRHQIYSLILRNSRRYGQRREILYDYTVPDQWQGRFTRLRVIGDKKGGRSTHRLGQHPELLERLQRLTGVPTRFVHVLRNPFDNISTIHHRSPAPGGLEAAVDRYLDLCATTASLAHRLDPADVLEIRHEDLLADPRTVIANLCRFVGLEAQHDYLGDCAGILFESPHRTRDGLSWPAGSIEKVESAIERYPFLAAYSFAA